MIRQHIANRRNDYIYYSVILAVISLLAIISVYLILNTPLAVEAEEKSISNNTSGKAVILPKTPSTDNGTILCTDSGNEFSIKYPSNWVKLGKCSFFTPNLNGIFSPDIETFVRISVTNLSLPTPTLGISPSSTPSIPELEREVIFFTDGNFFKRLSDPRLLSANAFSILYKWTGDYQAGLPYVNQFSIFSPTNTSTPFVIPPLSIAKNTSLPSIAKNTSLPSIAKNTSLPSIAKNTSQPASSNATAKDRFIAELNAIYVLANNKIYTIEYSAPIKSFSNPDILQAVTKMINSFTLTSPPKAVASPPPAKPANCNQPIFANTTACNPPTSPPPAKPANCNQPIFANTTACKRYSK
jgi:hypothetical protein